MPELVRICTANSAGRRRDVGLRIEEPDREVHAEVRVDLLPIAAPQDVHARDRDVARLGKAGAEVGAAALRVIEVRMLERQLAKDRQIVGDAILQDQQVTIRLHVRRRERVIRRRPRRR